MKVLVSLACAILAGLWVSWSIDTIFDGAIPTISHIAGLVASILVFGGLGVLFERRKEKKEQEQGKCYNASVEGSNKQDK